MLKHVVRLSTIVLGLAVAAAAFPSRAARAQAPAAHPLDIAYTVSMPEPATHLFDVSVKVAGYAASTSSLDFVMPVWTPGSYLVREFERNVQDFSASSASGAPLRWEKTDKATWRVWVGDAATREVVVAYRVYANELSVRTSHLDDSHAAINGASVFVYVDGYVSNPARVTLRTPAQWKVATGLAPVASPGGDAGGATVDHTFVAPSYDILVDSPFEAGEFQLLTFESFGKPHQIAIWGRGNYNAERLRDDVKKVVESAAGVFKGDVPYDRYVFIFQLFSGGGGGLEHLNSTTIQSSPFVFQKKESYQNFLELVAHEFFHLWLVKRIHPPALGPFDYKSENYTTMLWLMEGTTDYYAPVILQRAGLMTEEAYYKELAKSIQSLQGSPGRKRMSLEESSYNAWIKFYRRSEHSINDQVSYYLKGYIVSAMLDLEIRGRTKGAQSLDSVLNALWLRYGKGGQPVPEDGVQGAVDDVAASSFQEFFNRYVRGVDEIDYNAFLVHAGRKLVVEVSKDDTRIAPTTESAWIGANLSDSGGHTTVTSVVEGSPAWTAGLNANDEVLALDGVRVTESTLGERLADRKPGDLVVVTVFRRDELRTISIRLAAAPPDSYKIVKIEPEKKAG